MKRRRYMRRPVILGDVDRASLIPLDDALHGYTPVPAELQAVLTAMGDTPLACMAEVSATGTTLRIRVHEHLISVDLTPDMLAQFDEEHRRWIARYGNPPESDA